MRRRHRTKRRLEERCDPVLAVRAEAETRRGDPELAGGDVAIELIRIGDVRQEKSMRPFRAPSAANSAATKSALSASSDTRTIVAVSRATSSMRVARILLCQW
jgi:hypothetical protein